MLRRTVAAAVLLAVTTAPLPALQDDGEAGGRFPRKWLLAGVGAVITGAIAAVYAANFEGDIGGCSAVSCVVPITVGMGALGGFLIGSEADKLYNLRYAHAPPMSLRGQERSLSVLPEDMSLAARTVFITSNGGVELLRADASLESIGLRARGLRGIGAVAADSGSNTLLVGTPVGLYRFPLHGDAPGTLAHPSEISALLTDRRLVALGLGPDFQIARVTDSLEPLGEPVAEMSRVMDFAWASDRLLWVLTEDRLAAYAVDPETGAAEERGSFAFPALARRLAFGDTIAVVAAGSGGAYLLDVRDPAAPREITNWSGARFVYDVTMAGARTYAAAGPEGVYVLEVEDGRFRPVGLARQAGFVASVESDATSVYLLDRAGAVIRRIPLAAGR